MIRLDAPDNELPLAFRVGEHLGGALPAFERSGEPVESGALDVELAEEGLGLKPITIRGLYAPEEGANLIPWSSSTDVAGTLDADGLARVVYQQAKFFIEATRTAAGNTPPEVYITQIKIGVSTGKEKKRKEKKRRAPKLIRVIRYRDTKTGRLVKQSTWKRSRSHLRGKRGRYVREITTEAR